MISYPGDILQRFGRYEAVEDLGTEQSAHCWRAWDPFLERFVRVAALPSLDQTELHRTLPRLDFALKTWLGGSDSEAVLDFSPGNSHEPPFFILALLGPNGPPEAASYSRSSTLQRGTVYDTPKQPWPTRVLGRLARHLGLKAPELDR